MNEIITATSTDAPCKWCGERHDRGALCRTIQSGRRLSRRTFLWLGGSAAMGLALQPTLALPTPQEVIALTPGSVPFRYDASLLADAWNAVIGNTPEENIFSDAAFFNAIHYELSKRVK